MSVLLELTDVSKRYREGQRERTALERVSLQVSSGELVVVWGMRRSGKTTLLRVAAGIERADNGSVRFDGREQKQGSYSPLGNGIGYVRNVLRASEEQGVLEQVASPLLARGVSVTHARERARAALAQAGAQDAAAAQVSELHGGESMRVALARTLALSPMLLIVDEPTITVELSQRDGVLALLRSLAGEGLAVLACTAEPDEMAGAHRALTLSDGRLRGAASPELAPVLALHRRASA
ncbi:MAG: ATP-binding cassette domain-containing protein [Solirubrobacterales bacterium]|nr:ATP-binding cassette domain-containing protein [Solirubrobacterales bacterium]